MRALAVFDFDGTLTRGPTVCELLAERLGRLPRMRELEAISTEAEIAAARVEMAGWYRGVPERELRAALAPVRWAPGAHAGVGRLQENGVSVAIASITWSFALEWLAESLGVTRVLGTGLDAAGRVTHVWGRDKARWTRELAQKLDVPRERIAAAGDTPSDAPLLGEAGRAYYLGVGAPPSAAVAHRPNGDIAEIAEELLALWGES